MDREALKEITYELLQILNDKQLSPNDAKSIAQMLEREVTDGNEAGKKKYMEKGVFYREIPVFEKTSVD